MKHNEETIPFVGDPTIIFEDDDVLVIDKPAGMTVNVSDTTANDVTLQDWAVSYLGLNVSYEKVTQEKKEYKESLDEKEIDGNSEETTFDSAAAFHDRGGIVHRLDKETSGVILIAKTPKSFENLQQQFKERIVKKWYLALAHGEVKPTSGEINIPVGRLPWNRRQFGIVAGGREAVTFYTVIDYYLLKDKRKEKLTLLELEPKTGRTHQIRVHLKYLDHPIFADFLYAGRKTANSDRQLLSRVFLHAAKISFLHPTTKEAVTFVSPLPSELQAVIDTHLTRIL